MPSVYNEFPRFSSEQIDIASRARNRTCYASKDKLIDEDHAMLVAEGSKKFDLIGNTRIGLFSRRAADEAYIPSSII
jgi:hypothetical protein